MQDWFQLIQEDGRWFRKEVADSGLVAAGAEKWSLVQDW